MPNQFFDEETGETNAVPDEIERILQKQDEAMALLSRLRAQEPYARAASDNLGGGRRDFRRWPVPHGVTLELHNGDKWHVAPCRDMGVGGARLDALPAFVDGPVPARLKAEASAGILVLADVMWKDNSGRAGLRFEFLDEDERDHWSGVLIDALLAAHALS